MTMWKNTLEGLQDKNLKQTSLNAELLEYKEIIEILENKN